MRKNIPFNLKKASWSLIFFMPLGIPISRLIDTSFDFSVDLLPDIIGWALLVKVAQPSDKIKKRAPDILKFSLFGFALSPLLIARFGALSWGLLQYIQHAAYIAVSVAEIIVVWRLWRFALSTECSEKGKWLQRSRKLGGYLYLLKPFVPYIFMALSGMTYAFPVLVVLFIFPYYVVLAMVIVLRDA